VAGGVHQVDTDVFESDRAVLRGDGDSPLPFQVHGIHQALGHGLVVAEHAALAEHLVHQGGLAVIDMGNDRDIADMLVFHNRSLSFFAGGRR